MTEITRKIRIRLAAVRDVAINLAFHMAVSETHIDGIPPMPTNVQVIETIEHIIEILVSILTFFR